MGEGGGNYIKFVTLMNFGVVVTLFIVCIKCTVYKKQTDPHSCKTINKFIYMIIRRNNHITLFIDYLYRDSGFTY